ncbi:MAG: hypothetical protein C0614_07235 [Desulfuromonas sp.]|nr:MAG: hypothetical protein C0614_07235 [Desulfuromonas sp.]
MAMKSSWKLVLLLVQICILLNPFGLWAGEGEQCPQGSGGQQLEAADSQNSNDSVRLGEEMAEQAEVLLDQGQVAEALVYGRKALFHAQAAMAFDLVFERQWLLSRILTEMGRSDDALRLNQLAIESLRQVRAELLADDPKVFRNRIRPAYLDLIGLLLAKAESGDPGQRDELLAQVVSAIEELRSDELKDYLKLSCLPANDIDLVSLSRSEPDSAVLYLVDLPGQVAMVVVHGNTISSHKAEASARQIKAEAFLLAESVTDLARDYHPSASRLYQWLLHPIQADLAGVDTLVIVPDGSTRSIPFAALIDRQGRHLVEHYAIVMNPGLSIALPSEAQSFSGQRMFLGGISEAIEAFRAIPMVDEELQSLESSYPASRLQDNQFTVIQIEQQLRSSDHPLIHLASHGKFSGDVDQSFLLTWDGRLNIGDLSRIVKVGEQRRQAVDLIVLSACSTAAGDERAALGLAGVALKAGARSAIASLWNVDDQATGEFFVNFYRTLQGGQGVTKAEALRKAQLQFLDGSIRAEMNETANPAVVPRDFSHPFFWAPFVLAGDWH